MNIKKEAEELHKKVDIFILSCVDQDGYKNAYPKKSFTNPDFCVLKFTPRSDRYYSMYKPRDFKI